MTVMYYFDLGSVGSNSPILAEVAVSRAGLYQMCKANVFEFCAFSYLLILLKSVVSFDGFILPSMRSAKSSTSSIFILVVVIIAASLSGQPAGNSDFRSSLTE